MKLDSTQSQLNRTQEEFKETARKLEKKINALENRLIQGRTEGYTWKISGFSEVLRQAKSGEKTRIYSDPFSEYGYKSKMSLVPNGQGPRENTHLSVFFVLLKGEHDAVIPWPFLKKVTFALIDQQEDSNDRRNVVLSFIADPAKSAQCFARARPESDENPGYGFIEFVAHWQLKERRYVVNDTLFIHVKVTPP